MEFKKMAINFASDNEDDQCVAAMRSMALRALADKLFEQGLIVETTNPYVSKSHDLKVEKTLSILVGIPESLKGGE